MNFFDPLQMLTTV